jgi:hypothetical protein
MRIIFLPAFALLMAVGSATTLARAAGCVKGAALGGVAGHFAGHHGLLWTWLRAVTRLSYITRR